MSSPLHRRLLILDGHAYAYRAFHAIRELSSPTGKATNAIYGFIHMLRKLRELLEPSHLVVVWDGGLDEERVTEHVEYKSQRPPMPSDLEEQLDGITEFLDAAGIASRCEDGVEADDWIAAIARPLSDSIQVVIASSDKDFMQLVSDRIGLVNPSDKSGQILGPAEVRAKTGVEPEQIVDWLALIGDGVDNIPGVPGVGPKTATTLIQSFGSVDGIYSRLSEVKSDKLRARLAGAEQLVRKNQRLILLREDQPAGLLEELAPRPPDIQRLGALYSGWGFKTLFAQLAAQEPSSKLSSESAQGALL